MSAPAAAAWHGTAYGLHLAANVPVPGAGPAPPAGGVDVHLRLGELPPGAPGPLWYASRERDAAGTPQLRVHRRARGGYAFRYADGTCFALDAAGARVWARWPPELTLEDTATYLLGPILGFLLRLRGVLCLHASAVAVAGRAVALLGGAGAGKSTTAAAFAARGHRVLCDDVLALRPGRAGRMLVQPGYPRLRLWPDAVAALYGSPRALPRLTPGWDKRYLDLAAPAERFQREPLPLGAVYWLERRAGAAPRLAPLRGRSALMALLAHTYVASLLAGALRRREFEALRGLPGAAPLRRATAPAGIDGVGALCDEILFDFNSLNASAQEDPDSVEQRAAPPVGPA